MKILIFLALASVLSAQDPAPKTQVPGTAAESPATKVDLKPKAKAVTPGDHPAHHKQELQKREAQADKLSGVARLQKRRASHEQSSQARYKKAEVEELKRSDKAKRLAEGAQHQADAHQKKAGEIHQRAEQSWKAYLSLNAVPAANPDPAAVAPKKDEDAAKEPAKAEDAPK